MCDILLWYVSLRNLGAKKCLVLHPLRKVMDQWRIIPAIFGRKSWIFFLGLAFEVGTPAGNNYFLWYIIKIHQKLLTRATVQFAPLFSSTNGRPGIKWYKHIDVINGGFFSSPCWIRNSFGIASGIASCRPRCSKWSGGGNLGARRIAG